MKTPTQKAEEFVRLHQGPAFVIPNPWDAGSAKVLEELGFPALATSSAAAAGTLGRKDYELTRDEALAMAKTIVDAVDVPVSGDLENGFGDSPEAVAETVRLAASIGLAGCSIEDAPGDAEPYEFALATERIAAAAEVVRSLRRPFVLTARSEACARPTGRAAMAEGGDVSRRNATLDDVIRRLQAYERAGADVLFAVGFRDLAAYRAVCSAVRNPVNGIGGLKEHHSFTVAELKGAGVRRISVATGLWRTAMAALRQAAGELRGGLEVER